MKRSLKTGLLTLVLVFATGAAAHADQFAAIAFSQSTGAIGYAYNCNSLEEAEDLALSFCNAEDARVVTWSRNAYCALAIGDDFGAYGAAWGRTRAEAEENALALCSQYTTGGYIARWVYSGR
jgi:serine/threonine-protein kinase